MEVERAGFPTVLPTILKHIASSHFISFDLELSGIPTQQRRNTDGKQTLSQRYREIKAAAETFHILQIGLTCVEEDVDNERYLMRAYNFNLSPLINEGLDIERNFTYSTGAVDFLLQHNYRMEAPFSSGIPYLTRDETRIAKERATLRWDKDAIPDIRISADDVQALSFMARVRSEIDAWKKTRKPHPEYYNLTGIVSPTSSEPGRTVPLNRFEKRLTHQLVRAEYPDLQTFSRAEAVSVQRKDEEEQKYLRESMQRRLAQSIFTQVGFRWVADAMAGEDLSGLDPKLLSRQIHGEGTAAGAGAFSRHLNDIKDNLVQRKKVLVGHNCLLDLIYFYHYFYGSLPDTIEEFQETLHAKFSLIIDTKFMATSGPDGHMFRSSQLWQIEEALSKLKRPTTHSPSDHPKYVDDEKYHEAGFDSYVTANVFLKLAAKLEAPGRNDGVTRHETPLELVSGTTQTPSLATLSIQDFFPAPISTRKTKKKPRRLANKETPKDTLFSTNPYDSLQTLPDDHTVPLSDMIETPVSSSNAVKPDNITADSMTEDLAVLQLNGKNGTRSGEMIQPWDSDFWRVYGNKLRVYGTVEEVCDLEAKKAEGLDGGDGSEEDAGGGVPVGSDGGGVKEGLWGGVGKAIRSFI